MKRLSPKNGESTWKRLPSGENITKNAPVHIEKYSGTAPDQSGDDNRKWFGGASMSLEIFIGAGVAPSAANADAFSTGTQSLLFNGLNAVWKAADARLFSLETPLSDATICDACAPATCASGIAALSPTGVSLCTERIADCGAEGIQATRTALKAKQVAFFGAGEDIDAAINRFSSCGMVFALAYTPFVKTSARARRSIGRGQSA
jgi:hypothetical protein